MIGIFSPQTFHVCRNSPPKPFLLSLRNIRRVGAFSTKTTKILKIKLLGSSFRTIKCMWSLYFIAQIVFLTVPCAILKGDLAFASKGNER